MLAFPRSSESSSSNFSEKSAITSKNNRRVVLKPRYSYLVKIFDYKNEKQLIDEALLIFFEKDKSFTGEYVIELQVHGSRAVVKSLFESFSNITKDYFPKYQYRLAEAGEFTKRSLLNQKLDLTQVEALSDILQSETEVQLQQAFSQYHKKLTMKLQEFHQQIQRCLAHLIAYIDFGDDDLNDYERNSSLNYAKTNISKLRSEIVRILQDDKRGQKLRDASFSIALLGSPNVGKSSLLNLLANEDIAIVSDVAGTTRDVLETKLNLGGFPVLLYDTAGFRNIKQEAGESSASLNSQLQIEKEGMKRAIQKALKSDIIILIKDLSRLGEPDDDQFEENEYIKQHFEELKKKKIIVVYNKVDLPHNAIKMHSKSEIASIAEKEIHISCTQRLGIEALLEYLSDNVKKYFETGDTDKQDSVFVTRERHRQCLEQCVAQLDKFLQLIESHGQNGAITLDIATEYLRGASWSLGSITGQVDLEQVLDIVFKEFCIGK